MQTLSYTSTRAKLAETMDEVCENHTPVIITRQKSGAVVLISLEDYSALEETCYLLKNPTNAARLAKSVAQIEKGKAKPKTLKK